jgi:hypothetical protein
MSHVPRLQRHVARVGTDSPIRKQCQHTRAWGLDLTDPASLRSTSLASLPLCPCAFLRKCFLFMAEDSLYMLLGIHSRVV